MSRARRAIIAVFGGNDVGDDVLRLAEDLGRDISERAILLTGGREPTSRRNVKDRALRGASAGPWIGIAQSKRDRIEGTPVGSGFAIDSGLDDRRNFLNAHLCDAAVALEGRRGTVSEAVFAMALGKPLVLVGRRHWRERLRLDDEERWRRWAEAIRWVTSDSSFAWPELDERMEPDAILRRLQKSSPAPVVMASTSASAEILESLLPRPPLRALTPETCFPVPAPRYDAIARRLVDWIHRLR
jgi:uncharacterized protein (TIGR00725 family)